MSTLTAIVFASRISFLGLLLCTILVAVPIAAQPASSPGLASDTFNVGVSQAGGGMTIDIAIANADPSGTSSIAFENGSNENARIEFAKPVDPQIFLERVITEATIGVVPIDRRKDARGVVLIDDRSGVGEPVGAQYIHNAECEIELDRTGRSVALRATTVQPCLFVGDLDFGTLTPGESSTRNLEICNNGDGEVRFHGMNPGDPANAFITWLDANFAVGDEFQTLLRNRVLGPNECVTIQVTFTAPDNPGVREGAYRDTARLWASTRDCRDTSIWTANVIEAPTGVPDDSRTAGFSLSSVAPNPSSGAVSLSLRLDFPARTLLTVHDIHGRRVATLIEGELEPGEQALTWDAGRASSGLYTVRAVVGDRIESRTILLVR